MVLSLKKKRKKRKEERDRSYVVECINVICLLILLCGFKENNNYPQGMHVRRTIHTNNVSK